MDAFTDDAVLSISSFLHPHDLFNLALTCKRFGGTPIVDGDGARSWSLMEESARQRVAAANAECEWTYSDILMRRGRESWMALDHRLHRSNASGPVFHRLVGKGISYVKNDPSRVQVHDEALSSGLYPLGSSCAICQTTMTSGRHYAEFAIAREGYIEVGIVRPIHDWDARGLKTMHPACSNDYKEFCARKQRSNGPRYKGDVHCYLYRSPTDNLGRSGFLRGGDVVGLLLDLDQGTLVTYKNRRSLGVKAEGLAGNYCWVTSITNAVYKGAVQIEIAPFPSD